MLLVNADLFDGFEGFWLIITWQIYAKFVGFGSVRW
jgi:hypothetical protein